MRVVIAFNCVGTGIGVLTEELLLKVDKDNEVKFFKPYKFDNFIINFTAKLFSYLYSWMYILLKRPTHVYILANYFPFPTFSKVVVIMRHPFLLYNSKYTKDDANKIDRLRRAIFKITCFFCSVLIVQKEAIRSSLLDNFSNINFDVHVLANPVRSLTYQESDSVSLNTGLDLVIYPSGYYSHKGLASLFKFISYNNTYISGKYLFVLLFNKNDLSEKEAVLLNSLSIENNILFLGPIPPSKLNYVYDLCALGIFPSEAETFGNGLLELEVSGIPFAFTSDLLPFDDSKFGTSVDDWETFNMKNWVTSLKEPSNVDVPLTSSVLNTRDWFKTLCLF